MVCLLWKKNKVSGKVFYGYVLAKFDLNLFRIFIWNLVIYKDLQMTMSFEKLKKSKYLKIGYVLSYFDLDTLDKEPYSSLI